ncbi:MAG TPA: nucleotide pyrophosphohydrolase [Saprospiraceae bacterium]|nr:nucleotide pyrophosphohydrolase [Saprospiraceae bacterium]
MNEIKALTKILTEFRDARDWKQFHNPKDLALALSIEAAELNELFLWKQSQDADIEKVKDELADVFTYAFFLAENLNLDVSQIIKDKLAKSALKYPVEKAKGTMKKYDEL